MKDRLSISRKGDAWKDEGVAKFKALAVRSFRLNGQQVFVVIDTAFADNRGHASIYAVNPKKGDGYTRKLRSILLPLLEKRISIKEAFE